ncbi:hypothetical protein PR048_028601 [Dryococelus australis]|uniref:Uncharacterized protein n=1 Tax=Dryococelus australis TaxID=614101 RepID=A0ABQ9GET5_9NEOP|nr:hypothetical protein PR048_028601 [Dryococelus australis]
MATRIQRILALASEERLAEIDKRTKNEMAHISRVAECPMGGENMDSVWPAAYSSISCNHSEILTVADHHVEIHPATSETIFDSVPLMETVSSLNSVADLCTSDIPKIAPSSTNNSANMNASLNTEEPQNVLPREVVQLGRSKKDGKGKYLTKKEISDWYDASVTNHMLVCMVRTNKGKASGVKRLSERKSDEVISHIKRFTRYTSHYCRAQTSSDFLPCHH